MLSIGELATRSGLSTHTLRFYESAGVLKPANRAANGHRQYVIGDILWLEFVLRLKQTGMPLSEIKRYAALRERGDVTLKQRLTILKQHRAHLATKFAELINCANALDAKIQTYKRKINKQNLKK